jgi:hypothetical protein
MMIIDIDDDDDIVCVCVLMMMICVTLGHFVARKLWHIIVHANVGRWVLLLWYYVPWYVILITV